MTTRHIVPRADGEGGLGREAKKWGEVWADFINGFLVSQTPGAETIPAANTDGKLSLAWLPTDTAPKPGTIPVADGTGKLDSGWLPASAGGGGASFLTLVHSVSAVSREGEEYGGMMSTRIIPVSGWFRDRLRVLLDRGVSSGGTGQLRVSVAGVSAETEPFTSTGRDILVIDMSETSRDAAWPILIEGKASTGAVTVDRVKIVADPTDEMAGTIVLCLLPETTCSQSTFSELARESFITAQVPLVLTDINSAVMVGMDVEISGVGVSGEIKIELIGAYGGASASESSTVAIPESGIFQAVIKFPSMVTPMTEIVIQGRITSGSGTMTLNTLQALVLH